MNRVLIIGCPGAGKSTFARKLRDKTALPLTYLDMLWHRPDGTHVPREDFDRALEDVLKGERWIIDGNYLRTMERRLQLCDRVFFLNLPTRECLAGAEARIGQPREDMPWFEKEIDEEFYKEITEFPQKQLPIIGDLLQKYQHQAEITEFRTREEADRWLKHYSRKEPRKYYEAYDDRYRQVHAMGLQWSSPGHSPVVEEMLRKYAPSRILEIGCGEGRDAAFLLDKGYNLTATDISPEAIAHCQKAHPRFADRFRVLDCLIDRPEESYDFIFAMAVLHMLVEDSDRRKFYRFIADCLSPDGRALVCSMGDGEIEAASDPSEAFCRKKRIHGETGREVEIAATSCRMVPMNTFRREITDSGLSILETGIREDTPGFSVMMYAVISNGQQEILDSCGKI